METGTVLIIAIAAAVLSALATALIMLNKQHTLAAQVKVLETQLDSERQLANTQIADKEQQHQNALAAQQVQHEAMLSRQTQAHQEAIAAQQRQFDETLAKVEAQMKLATDEMLKQRQKEFAESSGSSLGQIVNPLRETIDKMKQAMDDNAHRVERAMNDNTEKQTAMSSAMKQNIEHMMQQSAAAQKSAEELNRTFRMTTKVQGDWGETILDELLEAQGLKRGIHYDTQPYIRDAQGNILRNEHGTTMRPDVILHLDQRREVIIDSKVSLAAFMDYANAQTEEERQRYLRLHIESLKAHVRGLAAKDYSAYIQPPKARMDYVIMFVPHSGALWTALHAQPDLWRNAMAQNVFIADEQTLFAALRIINLTWTQIAQAQNHEKVYALANEMLDRVGQFIKKYEAIGQALNRASQAYDEGKRKLEPTGQSILTTCKKLEKLGAKQSDKNPLPQLTDIDDIPALEANDTSTPNTHNAPTDEAGIDTPNTPQTPIHTAGSDTSNADDDTPTKET